MSEIAAEVAKELGLTLAVQFLPFSKSERFTKARRPKRGNIDPTSYGLCWTVRVVKNGRDLFSLEYSQGIAHCPSYVQHYRNFLSIWIMDKIEKECEHGKDCSQNDFGYGRNIPKPTDADLWDCIVSDCDVLNYSFSDWVSNLGYSDDSISAKAIYDICLDRALAISRAVGPEGMARLLEAERL